MTVAPEGRRLLRLEARNAAVPIERKPEWIRARARLGPEYSQIRSLVPDLVGPFLELRIVGHASLEGDGLEAGLSR